MDIEKNYKDWLQNATDDPDLIPELQKMDDAAKEDAFYRDLAFGTGGLRGVIGAGTNRMNIYTVGKASQGLANYVKAHFSDPCKTFWNRAEAEGLYFNFGRVYEEGMRDRKGYCRTDNSTDGVNN